MDRSRECSAERQMTLPASNSTAVSIPPAPPVFIAPKNRDAWSTIRGFVFQADLIVERWLRLDDDQELQLECGEDIDTVTRYIQAGNEERLLEQVKHRDVNVTLKSASALAALANAIEHRRTNPGLRLLFRYTTNALVGRERITIFPGKTKAIDVWERLRTEGQPTLPEDEVSALIGGIRQLLTGVARPKEEVAQDIWDHFKEFWAAATDDEIREFISVFEWSTGSTAASDMSDAIQLLLTEEGHAFDPVTAFGQYQRLFLVVMKTLSQRTGKRLTRTTLLKVIRQPLSGEEQQFFENFLKQMSLLDRNLAFLQAQMGYRTSTSFHRIQNIWGNTSQYDPAICPTQPSVSEKLLPRLVVK